MSWAGDVDQVGHAPYKTNLWGFILAENLGSWLCCSRASEEEDGGKIYHSTMLSYVYYAPQWFSTRRTALLPRCPGAQAVGWYEPSVFRNRPFSIFAIFHPISACC